MHACMHSLFLCIANARLHCLVLNMASVKWNFEPYLPPSWVLKRADCFLCAQAEANMHDEMFGHLLAAMRFGADEDSCLAAIRVAFR